MAISISTELTNFLATSNVINSGLGTIYSGSQGSTRALIPAGDYSNNNPYYRFIILIEKGVRPSEADFKTNYSQYFWSSANTLLRWNALGTTFGVLNSNGVFARTPEQDGVIIQTSNRSYFPLMQGVNSGTATWFAVCNIGGSTNGTSSNGNELRSFVLGDVGGPGSGNDIEMTDTNIIAGSESNLYGFAADLEIRLTQL